MPANMENSAVTTGLGKFNFHSNPKEAQCQVMFKLPSSFSMLLRLCTKSFRLGFSSTWTKNFQMYKLGLEKAKEPESKLPTLIRSWRKHQSSRKTSTSVSLTMLFDCVDHNKLWKLLKEMGIPALLTCLLRNWDVVQEATVRSKHGTTDWFKIGRGVCQCCISSVCLFNL